MKTPNKYSASSVLFCVLTVLAAAQGCGDDSDANPTPPDTGSSGKSTGGKGGGGKGSGASSNQGGDEAKGGETSSNGGTGATGTEGGVGNEGGTGGTLPLPTCDLPELGEDGCFNCPKKGELEQWLNRCTEGDCLPFDNAARLPKLNADGSRPDLPN